MKNAALIALTYLIVGGFLTGGAVSAAIKECGPISNLEWFTEAVLLWPAALTASIAMAFDGVEFYDICGPRLPQPNQE